MLNPLSVREGLPLVPYPTRMKSGLNFKTVSRLNSTSMLSYVTMFDLKFKLKSLFVVKLLCDS